MLLALALGIRAAGAAGVAAAGAALCAGGGGVVEPLHAVSRKANPTTIVRNATVISNSTRDGPHTTACP